MKTIKLEDLNILQKYCDNRVSYEDFKAIIQYSALGGYIEAQWNHFVKNPIRFITSRNERKLLEYIIRKIEITNYRG